MCLGSFVLVSVCPAKTKRGAGLRPGWPGLRRASRLRTQRRSGWYSLQVHFFHFRPLPQGQGSLRPILVTRMRGSCPWRRCRGGRALTGGLGHLLALGLDLVAADLNGQQHVDGVLPDGCRPSHRTWQSPRCGTPPPGHAGRSRAGPCPACSWSMLSMWSIHLASTFRSRHDALQFAHELAAVLLLLGFQNVHAAVVEHLGDVLPACRELSLLHGVLEVGGQAQPVHDSDGAGRQSPTRPPNRRTR